MIQTQDIILDQNEVKKLALKIANVFTDYFPINTTRDGTIHDILISIGAITLVEKELKTILKDDYRIDAKIKLHESH